MQREFRKACQQHGLKLWALPAIVVLGLAVLLDRTLDPYLERRSQSQDAALKVDLVKSVLDRQTAIERSEAQARPSLVALQPKLFQAGHAGQAAEQMAGLLKRLLESLYFEMVQVTLTGQLPTGDMGPMTVQARFFGVPQQLPRLEEALLYAEKINRLSGLTVKVVPDEKRGGQQLEIHATVTGFYIRQDLVAAPAPAKTSKK